MHVGDNLAFGSVTSYLIETDPGYLRWLLVRRSLTPNTKGELELAYYLCLGPVGTSIEDLARKRRPELTRGSASVA